MTILKFEPRRFAGAPLPPRVTTVAVDIRTPEEEPAREVSAEAEEGFRRLNELFEPDTPAPSPARGYRRYVLEYQAGRPVFWEAHRRPVRPRDELELMLDRVFDEVLDNDIVPKKLAAAFPGSRFEPTHYG